MATQKEFEEKIKLSLEEMYERRKGQVNIMMEPEFIRCDIDEMWAEFRFPLKDWEKNIAGHLHGGITATMFDFSMGVLTRNVVDLQFIPTVELNITYLRAVTEGDAVVVRSKVEKLGSRIIHLSADMFIEKNGKRAAMARGMFLNENTS